ncbi:MAG: L-threonylcarbamoyladenylate synthase [Bifidobacteriaceae bacterium]|jgi:tRNA threonylcarbamoyl adenosine modification protein (Sua5/YciO/YrdC/YwlC family)|nr:L-threonylcarbamoyladenylate synthase [Bifidobacteriaceae bacterium]
MKVVDFEGTPKENLDAARDSTLTEIQPLQTGEVREITTDTVDAYVCRAFDHVAVRKIFEMKQRSYTNNLPVFCYNFVQVRSICRVPADLNFQRLTKAFWPGALTIVLPAIAPKTLWLGDGPQDTIAVRIPNDLQILELCRLNGPLAQTSANISGIAPEGVASTIISWDQETIQMIREGQISLVSLLSAIS